MYWTKTILNKNNGGMRDIMKGVYHDLKPSNKFFKRLFARIILWFLGRGIQSASSLDNVVKEEVKGWDESTTIMLKVNDYGPYLSLQKRNGKLRFLGTKRVDNPNLAIYFKNIEVALLVLTGRLGIAQGFAEHRYTVKGDIALAMSFVRILYIVEFYLFPRFMTKKILKQEPKIGSNSFKIYLGTLLGRR